jgi:RNA polymerase sigma-70 factor (ECF subfamily)
VLLSASEPTSEALRVQASPDASEQAGPTPARAPMLEFEQIYDQNVDFVWRSARRVGVSEDALDDIVQQVFMVVHRRLEEFEGRSSLKTWVFSILLRVVKDHRRSLRRKSPHQLEKQEPIEVDTVADPGSDPFEALSRAEAAAVIEELLDCLEEDKRVVFVLAELEQMTAPEIAEAPGLEPKVVYSRLRAARTDFERAAAQLRQRSLWQRAQAT